MLLVDRSPIGRPAGARVELGLRAEQLAAAADAAVDAFVLAIVIVPAEGALGALLAGHVVLHGRELGTPLGIGLGDFGAHAPSWSGLFPGCRGCAFYTLRPLLPNGALPRTSH